MPGTNERHAWRENRITLETNRSKSNITKFQKRRRWLAFTVFLKLSGIFFRLIGLYNRGNGNALNLKLNSFKMEVPQLPKDFQGLEIVHLTDIHFDRVLGIENKIVQLLENRTPDLIVMTGDYKDNFNRPAAYYENIFKLLGEKLHATFGIYAVLGNHDTADLVPIMEKNGIHVLINESIELKKGTATVTLTGVDDIHYYFSSRAIQALDASPPNACKILLVHSPEMVKEAEARNYSLYLCGHTHAGQISLPNGKPLVTHVNTGKPFAVGRWHYKKLQGYTSSGAGVSGLTLRYFTQSEIAVIQLV